jgi:HlyD family secretion protein
MNKAKTLAIAVGASVLAGGAWFYSKADASEAPAYRYATVERGDVSATVSATGKLNAVRTVQVGTQVSGQVSQIFVDFNDKVRKGQLLATIDPTLQQQAVQDAQAGLERAQAQLNLAQQEYDRNKQLFDAKIITAAEYGTVEANLTVAKSNVKSANIALSRARQNLSYTNIHSPIDGVIVERNVDVGQTVAASLSAPQLFLIANDLADMQILASVDESDIGNIQQGQDVRFTVQSYPNREFSGKVSQVRLQSTTTDNVVSYTAVVSVKNTTGALLPGMTATLSFVTGEATDVLTVPSAALRYRPEGVAVATQTGRSAGSLPDSVRARFAVRGATQGTTAAGQARARPGTLWYLDAQGNPESVRVRTGLTDGSRTVVTGEDLKEGMQVIVGASSAGGTAAAAASATSNPLQPRMGGQRRF